MPTLDREPCPVEVPIVREKHTGFRFNKQGRGTLFVRPRDFSAWLTGEALIAARPTLNRHSLECAKRERERTFRK